MFFNSLLVCLEVGAVHPRPASVSFPALRSKGTPCDISVLWGVGSVSLLLNTRSVFITVPQTLEKNDYFL